MCVHISCTTFVVVWPHVYVSLLSLHLYTATATRLHCLLCARWARVQHRIASPSPQYIVQVLSTQHNVQTIVGGGQHFMQFHDIGLQRYLDTVNHDCAAFVVVFFHV